MIRIWKLLRLFWAMISRTPYVNWRAANLGREDELRYRAYRNHVGCGLICKILGIEVCTEGPLPDRSGMLIVSNHFGVLDPLILASVLPMALVGKAEVTNWPLLGWVSVAHAMIPVERERRSTVTQFAKHVGERLEAGVNVAVFPEGTTSAELGVRPFKTGAFEAVSNVDGGAVFPVYLSVESIDGQPADERSRNRVVWAGDGQSFVAYASEVASIRHMRFGVRMGTPIPTGGRDRKELAQLAYEAVEHLRQRGETIHT